MNDFLGGACLGWLGGLLMGVALVFLFYDPLNELPLTACARENNVYQCEMVAVPKTQEN